MRDYLKKKIEALNPSEPTLNEDIDKKKLHLTRQAEKALKTTFLEAKLYQDTAVNTAHLLLCIFPSTYIEFPFFKYFSAISASPLHKTILCHSV